MLWSTTYLVALRDCELFSTTDTVNKHALINVISNPDDWALLNQLACWVWEERFFRSGYEVVMGNNLCVALLEVCCHALTVSCANNMFVI